LLIQQSGYTHALVHAIFTSQFSLPPPPTRLTLTSSAPHSRRPSPQYLQPSHLVRGLHLLKSNEKVIEALSALFSGINSNCSQSTGHCTCILTVAISKPYAEDQGLQKSRIRFITNRISFRPKWNAYFHSKRTQVNTCTMPIMVAILYGH